ncbi:SAM-dependent methyltransferase [Pseudoalteromonas sp. CF6-2]|uniref:N-6 DNA methylase n=1 Tax=Pseudoalteromonas sp. CF6-2 TaxID=562716 RepID=UPI001F3C69E1|nr:SAM-dependent methyltransferase [Pseudoalteromonas sp. CF6-2]
MNNDIIESLVSVVVQSYKFVGFAKNTIHERDQYLTLLTCVLVKSPDFDNLITECEHKKSNQDFLATVRKYSTNKVLPPALKVLLNELEELTDSNSQKLVFSEVFQLRDNSNIQKLSRKERVTLYDRVLQRLQAMNLPDHFAADFSYQALPFNFAKLYTKLLQPKPKSRVYDPYAIAGESIVDFALQNQNLSITTESVNQSSRYIRHQLLIAGVPELNTMNSFALDPATNVKKGEFHYAITLLQPSIYSEIEDIRGDNSKALKGNYEENRIPKAVLKSRFWEHALIHHMLYSLNDSGKAVIITGKGPLSRHSDFHSRKQLVDNNQIDAIIQLPPKLLDARTVPLFAIILNKKRSNSNKITFIDARNCYTPDAGIHTLTSIDDIAAAYRNQSSQSIKLELVTQDIVIKNGYSLNVDTYVAHEKQHYDDIDVDAVQRALLKQQRHTDLIIRKLNSTFSFK